MAAFGSASEATRCLLESKLKLVRENSSILKDNNGGINSQLQQKHFIPFATRSHEFGDIVIHVASQGSEADVVVVSVCVAKTSTCCEGVDAAVQESLGDIATVLKQNEVPQDLNVQPSRADRPQPSRY